MPNANYQAIIKSINPNPTNYKANVIFEKINTLKEYVLVLTNIHGTQVKQIKIVTSTVNFDVRTWKPGIYNATLLSKGNVLDSKKFVVIK